MSFNLPEGFEDWVDAGQDPLPCGKEDEHLTVVFKHYTNLRSEDYSVVTLSMRIFVPPKNRLREEKPGMVIEYVTNLGTARAINLSPDNWQVLVALNRGGILNYMSKKSPIEASVIGDITVIYDGMSIRKSED